MFNAKQKEEYIKYYIDRFGTGDIEGAEHQLTNFFNRLENIELDFEADFADMDYDSIIITLTLFCTGTVAYQRYTLSVLTGYVEWAIQHGRTPHAENYLHGITVEDIDLAETYKLSMIKDAEQLNEYIDIAFAPLESDTIDNLYRVCMWLLYDGVSQTDMFKIKISDLDLENKIINYSNKIIKLNDFSIKDIRYYVDMKAYAAKRRSVMTYVSKANTNYLIDFSSPNRTNAVQYLRMRFSKFVNALREETGLQYKLTPMNVSHSGFYRKIYEHELETGTIDLTDIYNFYVTKQTRSKKNLDNPGYEKSVKKRFLLQYEIWKKAFDLA